MQNLTNIILGISVIILIGWVLIKPNTSNTPTPSSSPILSNQQENNPMPSPKMQFTQADQVINKDKSYTATLKTSVGDIVIELSQDTPVTTNNFVFLAQKGFYDSVIFHRVIPGFMIQGGDPTGSGMGGPGYKFADEKFTGEYKRGVVAMANAGANTNGSQFFIMHADYALPPNYVIFGMTKSGLDVVDKIASGKTGANDRPIDPVTIQSVAILEK